MRGEIFECPGCGRQFGADPAPGHEGDPVRCPACGRDLGRRDPYYVLRSEIEDLVERLAIERQRLEHEEATYALGDHPPELHTYARELPRVVAVLREAIAALEALGGEYAERR